MDIDCLLLAGGSSRRMGEPKLLLDLGGRTLFEHVLSVHLESSVRRICAVVPGWLEGFEEIMARCKSDRLGFVVLERECGMSESLKTGWKKLMRMGKPDAVLISLADKPLIGSEDIDLVVDCFARSGCEVCVPVFGGKRGHPVVLSAVLEEEVLSLRGDRGARTIVDADEHRVAEVRVDTDSVLVDVDTPDDLEEIRRRLDRVG